MDKGNSAVDKILKEAEIAVAHEAKQNELKRFKTDQEYANLQKRKEELARLANLDVSRVSDEYFDKMDEEQDRMIQSLHNRMPFINEELTDFVPFSYPNLLLVGAKSGDGKSTAAANIIRSLLVDTDENGEKRRVLVISNEEMALNVMNRVICLEEGWNYNDFKSFSNEQNEFLKQQRRILGTSNRLRVIDSDFPEFKDATTSFEGIKFILTNIEESYKAGNRPYDAIIIDYFQKISVSKEQPGKKLYDVLRMTTEFLDGFYKRYPAPVVVFSQIKPEAKDESDFEYRIKECKNLYVVCTHALEIEPDKKKSCSNFICHKHRFSSSESGTGITIGWEKGRFVPYTQEFQMAVIQRNSEREHQKMMAGINVGATRK